MGFCHLARLFYKDEIEELSRLERSEKKTIEDIGIGQVYNCLLPDVEGTFEVQVSKEKFLISE